MYFCTTIQRRCTGVVDSGGDGVDKSGGGFDLNMMAIVDDENVGNESEQVNRSEIAGETLNPPMQSTRDMFGNGTMTQDSEPFNLLPLIKVSNYGGMKRLFEWHMDHACKKTR